MKWQVLRKNGIGPHCSGLCGICRFSPEFPISLLELTSLRLIDLNSNELTFLPLDIAKMPKLVGLDVRENTISNIPDQVMVTARAGSADRFACNLLQTRRRTSIISAAELAAAFLIWIRASVWLSDPEGVDAGRDQTHRRSRLCHLCGNAHSAVRHIKAL